MTRRRSLESILPRIRSILRSLSIMSPACQITRARACQGGKARRHARAQGRELYVRSPLVLQAGDMMDKLAQFVHHVAGLPNNARSGESGG
jgi:hypothetical protein